MVAEMEHDTLNPNPRIQAQAPRDFGLTMWLRGREPFRITSTTAVADLESLRKIRDHRLYKFVKRRWADFCWQYAGATDSHINSSIRHLDEFGPLFFEL